MWGTSVLRASLAGIEASISWIALPVISVASELCLSLVMAVPVLSAVGQQISYIVFRVCENLAGTNLCSGRRRQKAGDPLSFEPGIYQSKEHRSRNGPPWGGSEVL